MSMKNLSKEQIVELAARYVCPARINTFRLLGTVSVMAKREGHYFWDMDGRKLFDVHINGGDMLLSKKANRFKFRRETVSFIFQTFNLFPSLTALENVQFVLDMANTPNSRQRALDVLNDVGLEGRVNHFPHELSGGEQQRVAIARALATGNPVLLADEPTGELDFKTGIQILELLEKQAKAGKTVLVVTHNREISRIADRVIELSSGKIVRDGPPRDGKAAIADLQW